MDNNEKEDIFDAEWEILALKRRVRGIMDIFEEYDAKIKSLSSRISRNKSLIRRELEEPEEEEGTITFPMLERTQREPLFPPKIPPNYEELTLEEWRQWYRENADAE